MKKIILGLPQTFSLYKLIKRNLEFQGFEVIDISFPNHKFQYKNNSERIINFFRKTFLGDKHYKNSLIFRPFKKTISKKLTNITTPVDHALLIRADIYPKSIIKLVQSKSKKMVSYHWDGLDRFPQIYDYIKYFDRFFVFDQSDRNKVTLPLFTTTNFAFDFDNTELAINTEYDIFYIGSYNEERMHWIHKFLKTTKPLNQKLKFFIHYTNEGDNIKLLDPNITYINKHISFDENLSYVKNSKVILDLLNQTHNGLSFRIFEALFYNKKIITNNLTIQKYDFYHPNNIYIWTGRNLDGYEEFLKAPLFEIPCKLKEKYSFKNWINYILNIEPYTAIELPD